MVKVGWVAALGYTVMGLCLWTALDGIYLGYRRRTHPWDKGVKYEHKIRGPVSVGVKFALKILGYDV